MRYKIVIEQQLKLSWNVIFAEKTYLVNVRNDQFRADFFFQSCVLTSLKKLFKNRLGFVTCYKQELRAPRARKTYNVQNKPMA